MGAIIMCALVSLIAIVGGVYFWIQDRKEERKKCDNRPPAGLSF